MLASILPRYSGSKVTSANYNFYSSPTPPGNERLSLGTGSFEILNRDEKTLGELFTFFILETILVAKCLKINPFDQPAVELIKKETKKILV